jgi:hypothetical protein
MFATCPAHLISFGRQNNVWQTVDFYNNSRIFLRVFFIECLRKTLSTESVYLVLRRVRI